MGVGAARRVGKGALHPSIHIRGLSYAPRPRGPRAQRGHRGMRAMPFRVASAALAHPTKNKSRRDPRRLSRLWNVPRVSAAHGAAAERAATPYADGCDPRRHHDRATGHRTAAAIWAAVEARPAALRDEL